MKEDSSQKSAPILSIHPFNQATLSPARKRELPTNQTYEPHNSVTPKLVLLECWNCGNIGHRKATCPNVNCFYCGKKGHIKRICINYKLALIQNNSITPESKKSRTEEEEKQDETLNWSLSSSLTNQPINYLIEEEDQTPNFANIDFELEKVLETQKTLNTINPETSPNSALNHNRETSSIKDKNLINPESSSILTPNQNPKKNTSKPNPRTFEKRQ